MEEEHVSAIMRGLPQTRHSALGPSGQIEQYGKIAEGLTRPADGWRRTVVRTGAVCLVLIAVLMISLAVYAQTLG